MLIPKDSEVEACAPIRGRGGNAVRWLGIAFVLGAMAVSQAAESIRWIQAPVPGPLQNDAGNPELILRNAAGEVAGRSAECAILSQGNEHRICGRIRSDLPGTYTVELRMPQPDGAPILATVDRAFSIEPAAFDVILVLDASHSMKKNDPGGLRLQATREFVSLAQGSRRIRTLGILTFREDTEISLQPTPPARIGSIDAILRGMRPTASTDFNEPFRTAAKLLENTGGKGVVLFLSDGEPITRYRNTHRLLAEHQWPVYTIGLSEEADTSLLEQIATDTGGQFFDAPSADQLRPIFTRIFRIIERPRTVVEAALEVAGNATLPFYLDATMHNTTLALAPGRGNLSAALDGTDLPTPRREVITFHKLQPAGAGKHVISFAGNGTVSCELTADTDVAVGLVPLGETAACGVPVALHFYVEGSERLTNLKADCELRNPAGKVLPMDLRTTPFGLFSAALADTTLPGRYTCTVEVTGNLPSGPIYRRAMYTFTRTAGTAPATAVAGPIQMVPPGPTTTPAERRELKVQEAGIAPSGPSGLQTTFWAAATDLTLPTLYPGGEVACDTDLLVNAESGVPVTAQLVTEGDPHIILALSGTIVPNRRSTLTINARATVDSAGKSTVAALQISAGSETWRIPVRGHVSVPAIRTDLAPFEIAKSAAGIEARAVLSVQLTPAGTCPLSLSSELPNISIDPDSLAAGPQPQEVSVLFRAPLPSGRQQWDGALHINGPGLASIDLPFTIAADGGSAEATGLATGTHPTPLLPLLPWLTALVAAVIIALLVATLRGSRRAAFLLVSALIHLVILFFALPSSTLDQIKESTLTTMRPGSGTAVLEENIAPEVATQTEPITEAIPEAAEAEKKDSAPQARTEEDAAPMPTEVTPPVEAQARPEELIATPERTALPITEPEQSTPDEPRRKQQTQPDDNSAPTPASPPRTATVTISDVTETPTMLTIAEPIVETLPEAPTGILEAELTLPEPDLSTERADLSPESRPNTETRRPTPAPAEARPEPATDGQPAQVARATATEDAQTGELPVTSPTRPAEPGTTVTAPTDQATELVAQLAASSDLPTEAVAPTRKTSPAAAPQGEPVMAAATTPSAISRPRTDDTATTVNIGAVPDTMPAGLTHLPAKAVAPELPPPAPTSPDPREIATAAGPPPPKPRRETQEAAGKPLPNLVSVPPRHPNPRSPESSGSTALPIDQPTHQVKSPATTATKTAVPKLPAVLAAQPRDIELASAAQRPGRQEQPAERPAKPLPTSQALSRQPERTENPIASRPIAVDDPTGIVTTEARAAGVLPGVRRPTLGTGQGKGRWRNTFPNLKHAGDWDCDRTAMLNLAHQFERRTGSVIPFDSRNVGPGDAELAQAPFLFMSGHASFALQPAEVENLRKYLSSGGYLWVNDSTDIGNETFDTAVRREMRQLFPDAQLKKIPMNHPLFAHPYDLSNGYRGYRVPPGDKYREAYLEGLWIDDRLTVIYTRNDYGDGLEIDARTQPLMASLTDLSPAEMQEGAIRMGMNIATYCMNRGRPTNVVLAGRAAKDKEEPAAGELAEPAAHPLELLADAAAWQMPEGWGDHVLPTSAATGAKANVLRVAFAAGNTPFRGWYHQAVVGRQCELDLPRRSQLVVDVNNTMKGGARIALGLQEGDGRYVESAPAFVRPGLNQNITFDLGAANFKSAETEWQYNGRFPETMNPTLIFLIIFPQQGAGTVELGNLRTIQNK